MKTAVLLLTLSLLSISTLCLMMSFLTLQHDGMFWYGLITVVLGVAVKIEVEHF